MKKGFTLVELLGTIVILGIIIIIAFPPILNQIKKSKEGIKETTEILIKDAAKDYIYENTGYEKIEGISYCIDISTLAENGYLNKKLKDDKYNDINLQNKIKATYKNNDYTFEIVTNCKKSLIRNGVEIELVEENSGLYRSNIIKDRFVYRGKEPQNFVELEEGNNETKQLYRIISFEPDGTIKVIRNTEIAGSWDLKNDSGTFQSRNNDENSYCKISSGTYYGCNVWDKQENIYYNDIALSNNFNYKYYKELDSIMLENNTSIAGTVSTGSYLKEYLNNDWINNNPKIESNIQEHDFYVGGVYNNSTNTPAKSLKMEKEEEKSYIWNGKIALANITDFVESSTNSACTSVNVNMRYNSNYYYDDNGDGTKDEHTPIGGWPCTDENNWMYIEKKEYTLSAGTNSRSNIWTISELGYFHTFASSNNYNYRPVFFLRQSINLKGEGTVDNPYKIQ